MNDVWFTDNSDLVEEELKHRIPIILEAVGLEAEGNAIDEVNNLVYSAPESKTYVRTGFLKNSITHAFPGHDGDSYSIDGNGSYHKVNVSNGDSNSVVIGSALEYAPYVEFGTSKMVPRPFLQNAIEKYKDDYKNIIKKGLT